MCWSVYSWGTISTLKTINSIYTPTERYSEKCRWRISLSLSLTHFFFLFLIDFLFIELDPQLKANALLSQIPQLTGIELCVCSLEKKTGVGATKWNHKIPRSSSTIYLTQFTVDTAQRGWWATAIRWSLLYIANGPKCVFFSFFSFLLNYCKKVSPLFLFLPFLFFQNPIGWVSEKWGTVHANVRGYIYITAPIGYRWSCYTFINKRPSKMRNQWLKK